MRSAVSLTLKRRLSLQPLRMFRRSSLRYVVLISLAILVLLYVYLTGNSSGGAISEHSGERPNYDNSVLNSRRISRLLWPSSDDNEVVRRPSDKRLDSDSGVGGVPVCVPLRPARVDLSTLDVYPTLDLTNNKMEYWDENFELRYTKRRERWDKLPLKVIIVFHSHNDPGWLRTFEGYYETQTAAILSNMVEKLHQYPDLKFIWSEISFLAKWWNSVHLRRRQRLVELVQRGQLEIVTGGWVMTDEANVHLYSMVDQLIEGHQWVKNVLNATPIASWTVDPFGHGATLPYLLKRSGFRSHVVQRIHHAWKPYLAEKQYGDFMWKQGWDAEATTDLMTHNFAFDIYTTKHSCGPHTRVCLQYDFRKIPGEYTDYSQQSQPIKKFNIRERAETLLAAYGRLASLYPHNVAIALVGDDFRYDREIEWEQQYHNYKQLIDYINTNLTYNAHVQLGSVSDYFDEVERRLSDGQKTYRDLLPKMAGDFFPYADNFATRASEYWTGYYTTRPFVKSLAREVEAQLRATEILFTLALNHARKMRLRFTVKLIEKDYERLSEARALMGLVQHHDAITGTSKAYVMQDYEKKLFEALQKTAEVLTNCAQFILVENPVKLEQIYERKQQHLPNFLYIPSERLPSFNLPSLLPVQLPADAGAVKTIVIFNPLAQNRQEAIQLLVNTIDIRVLDADRKPVPFQINPAWNGTAGPFVASKELFELAILVDLPALALTSYYLERTEDKAREHLVSVDVYNCNKQDDKGEEVELPGVQIKKHSSPTGDVLIENDFLRAEFSRDTGLLTSIKDKLSGKSHRTQLNFQSYTSSQFHSGAYLFRHATNQPVKNVSDIAPLFAVLRGSVYSEVIVLFANFMLHVIRVYHTKEGVLPRALQMDNIIDMAPPPAFRDTEMFMGFNTDIQSGDTFHTDSSGFQMLRRKYLRKMPIEGNYYPITTMVYIEDSTTRLSWVVSHAHGASSKEPGQMEVMLERRTLYDDWRGMGEGVVDQKRTQNRMWLVLEGHNTTNDQTVPSATMLALTLSHAINYPPVPFVLDETNSPIVRRQVGLIRKPFPCDVQLLNFRTLPKTAYFEFASTSALLVLHRPHHNCDFDTTSVAHHCPVGRGGRLSMNNAPVVLNMSSIRRTLLTGQGEGEYIDRFGSIAVGSMEINSYNVTFE